jgi:hypothetical protein
MIHTEAWFSHTASIEKEILSLGRDLILTYEQDGKVDWGIVHRLKALESRSGRPAPFEFELDFKKVREAAGHAYVELLAKKLGGQTMQRTFGLVDLTRGERPLYERVGIGGLGELVRWGKTYTQVPVTASSVSIFRATGHFRLSHIMDWDDERDTDAAIEDAEKLMRSFGGGARIRNVRVFPSERPDGASDTVQVDVEWGIPLELPLQESWISGIEAAT